MKEIVLAEILTILALADDSFPWFYESKSKRIKSENQSGPVWYRAIGLKIVNSQVDNWYPQLQKLAISYLQHKYFQLVISQNNWKAVALFCLNNRISIAWLTDILLLFSCVIGIIDEPKNNSYVI